ncbi:vanadium-dependent haloperoxidase [Agrococcus sp. DT81.2]|uniref:vanadium-dependent haloperoxidase n=1 Tax=Agrococcus sp. DT81.2 TaxID=3393414 RepID=UPI003CE483DE
MRSKTSWTAWLIAPVLVTMAVMGPADSATAHRGHGETGPPDASVANWDAVGTQAFTAAALSPAEGHTIFAYVAIAVYDSVMAVEGGYEPFLVDEDAPDGASAEAAVAAAARGVLNHYLPAQSASIVEPAYVAALAAIPDGKAESDGVAIGADVASQLIALRADDRFRAPATYTPPNPPVPGVFLPTAPTPPFGVYLGDMEPFALHSADQFRPDGPPDLRSRRWARDYNEVKDIGSSTSTTRTDAQTLAARFWAEAPVQQARGSFRNFVVERELDVVGAARFMAMISVTYADALMACFDAKYDYAFWRPITAIRAGDTDGNRRTVGDPSWSPLLPATPNHPEYPSAHSCITPAGGWVIARFLHTSRIDFTVPSLTGLGDRTFEYPSELTDEVRSARVWGGIHFRFSLEDGADISKRVTLWVLRHHFHRSHH